MTKELVKVGQTLHPEKGEAIVATAEYIHAAKRAHGLVSEGSDQVKIGTAKLCLGLSEVRANHYYLIYDASSYLDYAERIVGMSVGHAHRLAAIGENFSEEIINQLGVYKAGQLLALPVGDKQDLVQSAYFEGDDGRKYNIADLEAMTREEIAKIVRKHNRDTKELEQLKETYKNERDTVNRQLATALQDGDDGRIAVLQEQLADLTNSAAIKLAEMSDMLKRNETREEARKAITRARDQIETGIATLRDVLDHHQSDEVIMSETHSVLQNLVNNLTAIGYQQG